MTKEEVFEKLKESIVEINPIMAKKAAIEAKKIGIDADEAIENGLSKGMDAVRREFVEGGLFVPDLFLAAAAFQRAVSILV